MWPRIFGNPFRSLGNRGGGGNRYLLQDTFSDAHAAGSVNGTTADTGQARTVTDTNNKLSITGGVASIATGGSVSGNPGLWYPSEARVAGKSLLGDITISGNAIEFGFDSNQSGTFLTAIRPIIGNSIGINDNAVTIGVGPQPSGAGAAIKMCLIMRGTGMWYFIKGDVYSTTWILIWVSSQSSAALFPGFTQIGTTGVMTADNIRVPTALYIPLPLAYDTFTRANGALGSTETSGPDSQVLAAIAWVFTVTIWTIASNTATNTPSLGADVIVNGAFAADANWNKGANWSIAAGVATAASATSDLTAAVAPLTVGVWYRTVWTITAYTSGFITLVLGGASQQTHGASGTLTEVGRAGTTAFVLRGSSSFVGSVDNVSCKALTLAELFASVAVSTADVIADVAITLVNSTSNLPAGLVLNLDSTSAPANFVLVYLDGHGNCVIEECVAGVYATKQTTAVTYSAGAVLRVERSGTECRAFYNNAAVGSAQTMTSNTNTKHGLFNTNVSNALDGFTLWARGTSNEYATLDTL